MSGDPCLSADGNEWRKQLTGIECVCVCVCVCVCMVGGGGAYGL